MRLRPVLAASAVLTAQALTLSPATASSQTSGPGDPPVVTDEHAGALVTRNAVAVAVAPTKAQLAAVADVVAAAAVNQIEAHPYVLDDEEGAVVARPRGAGPHRPEP